MKLRTLFILVIVLLGCAAGLWLWPTGRESVAPIPGQPAPVLPAASSLPPSPTPALAAASPTPVPATPPKVFTSAVMPGQPVARSAPAPAATPRPAAARPAEKPEAMTQREPEGRSELENVRSMFTNFRTRLGENPTGTNAEIMKAVMGENKERVRLGPPHGQSLNGEGELVDFWGTPYFFHQLSKDTMEIRSAGEDRMMWTQDDLVTK